ncbi:FCD domain-containing protein [Mesorhizobium sp. M0954]|uniref:FCD domain-containing protein n=1 Tax=Mesorhizobium sp. M0954 TaxID=2957032 RepID=UPI00333C791F
MRVEWSVSRYGAGTSLFVKLSTDLPPKVSWVVTTSAVSSLLVCAQELEELTRTRCWLEEPALRESIVSRTGEREEQLVLALHRLARAQRRLPEDPSSNTPEWEKLHRTFHRVLVAGCRSRWLTDFCDQLSDPASRYRLISQDESERDEIGEHRLIAEPAVDGDAEGAVEALLNQYRLTAAKCMERFEVTCDPRASAAKQLHSLGL